MIEIKPTNGFFRGIGVAIAIMIPFWIFFILGFHYGWGAF